MLTACGHVAAFAQSETNLSWRPRYFLRQRSSAPDAQQQAPLLDTSA